MTARRFFGFLGDKGAYGIARLLCFKPNPAALIRPPSSAHQELVVGVCFAEHWERV
jgi:hypothetical protein